jgi:hypothetical protein
MTQENRLIDHLNVGTEVTCIMYGNGVVVKIDVDIPFPIRILFKSEMERSYTYDGRYWEWVSPTLFLSSQNPQLTFDPLPTIFNEGDPVWVCDDPKQDAWNLRFYSHLEDGKHCCFRGQSKSGRKTIWKNVKPFIGELP